MSNVTGLARSVVKTILLRCPLGPPLQTWYHRRRYIQDLRSWTTADDAALLFYSRFIGPDDVCFDIGANRGVRTKVFRRLAAKVVAVEPQHSCTAILRGAYGNDGNVSVVSAACGASRGAAILLVSEVDILSSLSPEWMSAVTRSGRFADGRWTSHQSCELVTLDDLIQSYGKPSFIKIDVEGYELNVLKGLTRAVPALSFEFTPERFETAVECATYLSALGLSEFNVSWGESFTFLLDSWVDLKELTALLQQYRENTVIYGDVYAKQ
jgi:FkbM family methyltransferase